MTKQERINEYNKVNTGYNITNIVKAAKGSFDWQRAHGAKSLDELYQSYSDAKRDSYREILNTYKPLKIIGLQGSSMSYSVTLVASNGDVLWITKCNNYLVDVVEG